MRISFEPSVEWSRCSGPDSSHSPPTADDLDVRVLSLFYEVALLAAVTWWVFAVTIQRLRELQRRRRLANLRRPGEEIRMRDAIFGQSATEDGHRPLLPNRLPHV